MKKREKIVLICALLLLPLMLLWGKLIFVMSGTTYAEPMYEEKTKGANYFYFKYTVDGQEYSSHASVQYFKIRDFDSLKLYGHFKVEYSKFFPSYTRIIDKEVGNEGQ